MKKTISKKFGAFLLALTLLLSVFSFNAFAADSVSLNYGTNGDRINVVANIPSTSGADYVKVTFSSSKTILYITSSEGRENVNDTSVTFEADNGSSATFVLEGVSNCTCNISVTYMDDDGSRLRTLSNSISPVFTGDTPNDLQNGSVSASPSNPNQILSGSPNIVTQRETTTASASRNNTTTTTERAASNSVTTTQPETTTDETETTTETESTTVSENEVSTTQPETTTAVPDSTSPEEEEQSRNFNVLWILFAVIGVAVIALIIVLVVYAKDKKKNKEQGTKDIPPADPTAPSIQQPSQNPNPVNPVQPDPYRDPFAEPMPPETPPKQKKRKK